MTPWSIESRWYDVAWILGLFAVGGILFGRFEEHKPRVRRVVKVMVITLLLLAIASWAGRGWAFLLVGVMASAAGWIHLHWLPKHGINGWTGEPREQYLALVRRPRR